MRTINRFLIIPLFWVGVSAFAFDIAAVGVLDSASPSIANPTTTETTSKLGMGYGVLASVYSIPAFTIESGLLSLTRTYAETALPTNSVSMKMWQVPVLLRFDLLPIVAAGIGGYLAFANGDLTTSNGVTDTSATYASQNLGTTDYGLMASVSFALPLLPTLKALVDARYLVGLANLHTTAGSTFKFKDLQLLAGVRLSL